MVLNLSGAGSLLICQIRDNIYMVKIMLSIMMNS